MKFYISTLSWCLRYNVCSTWFLDIRMWTCFVGRNGKSFVTKLANAQSHKTHVYVHACTCWLDKCKTSMHVHSYMQFCHARITNAICTLRLMYIMSTHCVDYTTWAIPAKYTHISQIYNLLVSLCTYIFQQ